MKMFKLLKSYCEIIKHQHSSSLQSVIITVAFTLFNRYRPNKHAWKQATYVGFIGKENEEVSSDV